MRRRGLVEKGLYKDRAVKNEPITRSALSMDSKIKLPKYENGSDPDTPIFLGNHFVTIRQAYKKVFGKSPHWKLKPQTALERLNDAGYGRA